MPLKNWGHVRSTEEPFEGSKSLSRGELLEQELSSGIHVFGVPILVSQKLFRQHGLGQVDICLYFQKQIILYEVKTHPKLITNKQYFRISKSLDFLIKTIDSPGRIEVINSLPKQFTFFNLSI